MADSFPFGFQTKYYDPETAHYYYGFRYYDPTTCKWLNRDPLEEDGGYNLFAFVNNDPVNGVDYLGCESTLYEDLQVAGQNPFGITWAFLGGWYGSAWKMGTSDAPKLGLAIAKSPYKAGNLIYDASYGMRNGEPCTDFGRNLLDCADSGMSEGEITKKFFGDITGFNYGTSITESAMSGDMNSFRNGMFNVAAISAIPVAGKALGPMLNRKIPNTPELPTIANITAFVKKSNSNTNDTTQLPNGQFEKIIRGLEKQRYIVHVGDDAALTQLPLKNANALYRGIQGRPGIFYFKENPTWAEVVEELKHAQLDRLSGYKGGVGKYFEIQEEIFVNKWLIDQAIKLNRSPSEILKLQEALQVHEQNMFDYINTGGN
ncbi:MAG: hypothetical protein A2X49_12160 [Lentisphaerae bacterium GWF2_52_8]|nr:MAG: hypothetical protein A2X49_12160 [Lentisphaerae bacterium GWF2_52_8]